MTRGWLGGTFDPIHEGHLDVARAAHRMLHLDRVTLVPSRVPPHRPQPMASASQRVDMARLAATESWLDVSTLEVDGEGPSYTAVTLDRLAANGVDLRDLIIITGADAFAGIFSWHRVDDILSRVSFAVVSRPGHSADALPRQLPALADRMCRPDELTSSRWGHANVVVLLDVPTSPVSSTQIRAAVAAGRSLNGLVPDAVAAYVAAQGLYTGVA